MMISFNEHQLLIENRVEVLWAKYADKISAKVVRTHRDVSDDGVTVKDQPYLEHLVEHLHTILVNTDPTRNKIYLDWLIRQYLSQDNFIEDWETIFEDLVDYERLKPRLEPQYRDINKFKTYYELREHLMAAEQTVAAESNRQLRKQEEAKYKADTTIIYDGPHGMIVSPRTEDASRFWGRSTRWCTAYTDQSTLFKSYDSKGPLYIFILPTGEKFQVHFETGQVMTAADTPIQLSHFVNTYKSLTNQLRVYLENNPRARRGMPSTSFSTEDMRIAGSMLGMMSEDYWSRLFSQIAQNKNSATIGYYEALSLMSKMDIDASKLVNRIPVDVVSKWIHNFIDSRSDRNDRVLYILSASQYNFDSAIRAISAEMLSVLIGLSEDYRSDMVSAVIKYLMAAISRQKDLMEKIRNHTPGKSLRLWEMGLKIDPMWIRRQNYKAVMDVLYPFRSNYTTKEAPKAYLTEVMHLLSDEQKTALLQNDHHNVGLFHKAGVRIPRSLIDEIIKTLKDSVSAFRMTTVEMNNDGYGRGRHMGTDEYKLAKYVFPDGVYKLHFPDFRMFRTMWWYHEIKDLDEIVGYDVRKEIRDKVIKEINSATRKLAGKKILILFDADHHSDWLFPILKISFDDLIHVKRAVQSAYHRCNEVLSGAPGKKIFDETRTGPYDAGRLTATALEQIIFLSKAAHGK